MPENNFAFVMVDDTGKARQGDRHLIRSQCMQGKNRREGSRRSLKRAAKEARSASHKSFEDSSKQISLDEPTVAGNNLEALAKLFSEIGKDDAEARLKDFLGGGVDFYANAVPPPPPLDIALIKVPADIHNECQTSLHNCKSTQQYPMY
jgi:hypothetical protein